jgi:hypothetical protein
VSGKLPIPETRICSECSRVFTATYRQRLCNPCRYIRAERSNCATCGKKVGHSGGKVCWECRTGPLPALRDMTPVELGWLSGLIEGEGYLGIVRGKALARVVMTDADVIDRLQAVSGVGVISDLPRRADHHKPVRAWSVARNANVAGLLLAVAPFLGVRRRSRAGEVLAFHGLEIPPVIPLSPGSDEAWAWVGALIEGEGCLQPSPAAKRQDRPEVTVDSTDLDIVERLREATGVGAVTARGRQRAGCKEIHRWRVSKRADARTVLSRTLPMLGERRSERALYIIRDVLRGESEIRTRGRSHAA